MFNSDWYNSLTKPPFSPPSYIFTPVWIILYILIGTAFVLYAQKFTIKDKTTGYVFFFSQLLLNFLWSPVFFGLKSIHLALVIIVFMDLFILLTIRSFYSISKPSGILLIPYFIWTLFATYLNLGYLFLN